MEKKKKKVTEYSTPQLVIRASDKYRYWLRCLAADNAMQVSEFIEMCINDYAKRNNKSVPPRRWPPETEG